MAARAWGRFRVARGSALWEATLCWTLVLSPYAPIYDAILGIAAVALVAGSMRGAANDLRERFGVWLLLLYMAPWITQSFAEFLHLQLFTVLLAGFGGWALALAFHQVPAQNRSAPTLNHINAAQEKGTMPTQLNEHATGRF